MSPMLRAILAAARWRMRSQSNVHSRGLRVQEIDRFVAAVVEKRRASTHLVLVIKRISALFLASFFCPFLVLFPYGPKFSGCSIERSITKSQQQHTIFLSFASTPGRHMVAAVLVRLVQCARGLFFWKHQMRPCSAACLDDTACGSRSNWHGGPGLARSAASCAQVTVRLAGGKHHWRCSEGASADSAANWVPSGARHRG